MTHRILASACVLAFVFALGASDALAAYPPPQKPLADFAGVIDAQAAAHLRALLDDVERQTTAEISVVTVASLDGATVEEYANGLFKEWGIGKKGADNGLLVLVCPSEKQVRIEVGYGLEPILPDILAGSIIRSELTPRFKEGDYSGGITGGVERLAAIVKAKHVLSPEERRALEQADRPPSYVTTPFFGVFLAIGAFMLGAGIRAKAGFPLLFGGLFGGVPALMALIPFFNASLLVLGLVAVGMFAWGLRKGGAPSFAAGLRGGGSSGGAAGSGWVMGSTSSGSGSSSSSGGSSSSGSYGGGSSGGGGASGSW